MPPARRDLRRPAALGAVAAFGVAAVLSRASTSAAPPVDPPAATRPADARPTAAGRPVSLHLDRVTAEQAYAALGRAAGCRFVLADGEPWVGSEVPVSLALDAVPFWQAFLAVGEQTGYEILFEPFAAAEDATPTIRLRRVDVKAEQVPAAAAVSGPLLVRPRQAAYSVTPDQARRELIAVQLVLEVEVFVEPGLDGVYVSAAGQNAFDGENGPLIRADARDPIASVDRGIGLLRLYFDARPKTVPTSVSRWQALLRLVVAEGRSDLRVPVNLSEANPAAQTVRAGDLTVRVDPPTLSRPPETAPAASTQPATLTVGLTVSGPNNGDALPPRAFDLVAATPVTLDDESGRSWPRSSSAALLLPESPAADAPVMLRVISLFQSPTRTPPNRLFVCWPLAKDVREVKNLVRWSVPLPVAPDAGAAK